MLNKIVVPLLCAAAIAVACGPRAHSTTTDAPAATTTKKRAPDEPTLASSLDISVKDGVSLAFHATNRDTKRIELVFPSGQTHDFAILDASGREVWRWSKDRLFTQALQNRVLEPSETITYEERWTPGELRGSFVAVATLQSSSHPLETRVEFTLP
jgi:hypothetical protein